MTVNSFLKTVLLLLLVCTAANVAPAASDLDAQFSSPPASARPWVYWFWIDGNITREGITADLEAMARVGIGGVLIMEVAQGTPTGPIAFASPQWRDLFKHAVAEASRLGLEVNMNNDAGWCGSGGPWNTPEHAMQKVVWTETALEGPQAFSGALAQPQALENYYKDIAVMAFPTPDAEVAHGAGQKPTMTTSATAPGADPAVLTDGNPATQFVLPKPTPEHAQWIQAEYAAPMELRTVTLTLAPDQGHLHTRIQNSEDGQKFNTIREFDFAPDSPSVSLSAAGSRFWRFEITHVDSRADTLVLGDLRLGPEFRIENVDGKSGRVWQYAGLPTRDAGLPARCAVARDKVVDLSGRMDASGALQWEVPPGQWTVIRFGHTTTGAKNAPSPASGTGLECDKLSKEAVEAHFNGLMKKLIDDCGPLVGKDGAGLTMTHIDSWEVGSQNWTPSFREDFLQRRGYDPLPMLPILTGRAITNAEVSERFLWDMRLTIGDLVADNYAGHLRELSHRNGIKLSIEAYGNCVFDNLVYAGRADMPMSEFWMGGSAMQLGKTMSSAAHTYGHSIVPAESFTAAEESGRWKQHPWSIKALGDQSFCEGVNRFVFHRYAMQPWLDRAPGMTMGPWGLHYERTETWWNMSGPWHEYLARCQFLLQQGRFAADVAYCIGEGAPNDAVPRANLTPPLPAGYDFDSATEEITMQMEVRDGQLVLPCGMRYRVLALPASDRMTPALLRKVKALVEAGATVVGTPPDRSPSLSGYPGCDAEVRALAAELWNTDPDKKHVLANVPLEKAFVGMGLRPDFVSKPRLRYIHRIIDGADAYFVANPQPFAVDTVCVFRVTGLQPEVWHPDTGRTELAAVYEEKNGCTSLPIRLDPSASVFVVFRNAPTTEAIRSAVREGTEFLPGAELMPKLTVEKAVYGVQEDPALTRDVRAELQQMIDDGTRQVRVIHLAQTGDPANLRIKTLVVEYTVGDRHITVSGSDSDTVELPDYAPKVVITNARYGVLADPAATRDVREKAQHLVETGVYAFPVTRMAEGDDPAQGVVKTLEMEYTVDGKAATATGTDSDSITLATPPVVEKDPVGQMWYDEKGRLMLEAWQSGVHTFKTASGKMLGCHVAQQSEPFAITGPWDVAFQPGMDAPAKTTFDRLISWSDSGDEAIKHFSGSATYTKTFTLPESLPDAEARLYLDLGDVQIMARVKLNGKDLGILWKPPFRVDITDSAKLGDNLLVVEVVNLWVNRLIGDEQLPEDSERNADGSLKTWPQWLLDGKPSPAGRHSFTTWRLWKKDSPLVPSGLLGPVRIVASQRVEV